VKAEAGLATGELDNRRLEEVLVPSRDREAYRAIDPDGFRRGEEMLERIRKPLAGTAIWHVNASATDAVGEVLRSLLGYARDGGLNAHWLTAGADHPTRMVWRRLYNNLYGIPGDGGELGPKERELCEHAVEAWSAELAARLQPGDVVVLHDPPVAGLLPVAKDAGAHTMFRCHLGLVEPNAHARRAWDFLHPWVSSADAYVFTRPEYVWEELDRDRVTIQLPSLDPFSPKNQELGSDVVLSILDRVGLTRSGAEAEPIFTRFDGSPYRINVRARIDQNGPIPVGAEVVAQVSGWERLKDQAGLVEAFARSRRPDLHLVLAGPSAAKHSEESEERRVIAELREQRRSVPETVRSRIHLVEVPDNDRDENAAIVNAIQRRADIVVHKSLQEGFGLSVTEAMWKGRSVLASRVGGIPAQIVDGETGVLVDPGDLAAVAERIDELMADARHRRVLGAAAREHVARHFLTSAHFAAYLRLVERILVR
jgi:trehalose synthase